jgi:hypothetical protein
MNNWPHKPIKRFEMSGTIYDEAAIAKLKIEYIRMITLSMQLNGYIPRIDIEPDFTIKYIIEQGIFEFRLSVYGIYIGKKKAQWILGTDGTRVIYIPKNKLNVSLQEQA